jgi:hypothetical protein
MGWRAFVQFPGGSELNQKAIRKIELAGLSQRHPTDEGLAGSLRNIGLDVFDDEAVTAAEAGEIAVRVVRDHLAGPDTNTDEIGLINIVEADVVRDGSELTDGNVVEGEVESVVYDDENPDQPRK